MCCPWAPVAPPCLCQFPKAPLLCAGVIFMCFLSALIIHRTEHLVWLVNPADEILYTHNEDVWSRSLPVNGAFFRTSWTHREGKILGVLGFTLLLPQVHVLAWDYSTFVFCKGKLNKENQLTRCYNVLLWLPRIDWSRSPHRSAGGSLSAPTQCTWWNLELVRSLPLCVPLQDLDLKHTETVTMKSDWIYRKKQSWHTQAFICTAAASVRTIQVVQKTTRLQYKDAFSSQINKKDLISETHRFTVRINLSIIIWS